VLQSASRVSSELSGARQAAEAHRRQDDDQVSISSGVSNAESDHLYNQRKTRLQPNSVANNAADDEATTTKEEASRTTSAASRDSQANENMNMTPRAPRIVEDPHSIRRPSLSIPAEALKIGRAREIEALETKIKIMERRRLEDRVKLQALEQLQAERDRFENVIQKLQTKYQPQQQELVDIRRQLKESRTKLAEVEESRVDHDSALEMATLDREMAEETAEALRTELESLKAQAEELDEEVRLLREENEERSSGVNERDRTSHGWVQLEKSNERLKEALLRLREVTQAQAAELKTEVKTLQDELKKLSSIDEQYRALKVKVAQSDEIIQDLKQQLELAAGAEDMIEELTDKNLTLAEQLDALKLTVEDLESLKELNDELEANHLDAEKQLQAELDRRDSLLADYEAQSTLQSQKLVDQERTIVKFRQLISSLQTHLENLKSSKDFTQAEADELNTRARGLIETNAKLQTVATRTKLNVIELEIVRFQAQEAASRLEVWQLLLPEDADVSQEPLEALLTMKRLSFNSRLLHRTVSESLAIGEAIFVEQTLECCNILDNLLLLYTRWDAHAYAIQHCDVDELELYRRWYRTRASELSTTEQNLGNWLHSVAAGDFSPGSFQQLIAQEVVNMLDTTSMIADGPKQQMKLTLNLDLIGGRIDNILKALSFLKTMLFTNSDHDITGIDDHLAQVLDEVHMDVHSTKRQLNKIVTAKEDVSYQQESISAVLQDVFLECSKTCEILSELTQVFGRSTIKQVGTINVESQEPRDGLAVLRSTSTTFLDQVTSLATQLADVASLSSTSGSSSGSEPPSTFILLANHIKASRNAAAAIPTHLDEVNDLRVSLQTAQSALHNSNTITSEQSLKISLLEARMQDAGTKAARIIELETLLDAARAREQELELRLDEVERELSMLREREQTNLESLAKAAEQKETKDEEADRATAVRPKTTDTGDQDRQGQTGYVIEGGGAELAALKAEVNGLCGIIRHLRASEAQLLYHNSSSPHTSALSKSASVPPLTQDALSWLREPLGQQKSTVLDDEGRVRKQAANDLFDDFLAIVTNAGIVRLKDSFAPPLPKAIVKSSKADNENKGVDISQITSRLTWRPAKQKTAWIVARQREEWETWQGRTGRFIAGGAHHSVS